MSQQTPIDYSAPTDAQPEKKKGRAQEIDQYIGQRIKDLRKSQKMTQNDLADQLNVSFQQIQKYEKGKSRISFAQIIELSKYMGLPLSAFLDNITGAGTTILGMADSAEQTPLHDNDKGIQELTNIYHSLENASLQQDFIKLAKTLAENMKK